MDYFDTGQTYVCTLKPQWHILNMLITHSIVPNATGSHKIPKRVLYAMYSMGYLEHMLHLGSFVANTISRCHEKPNHLFYGPLITRLARHFEIDLEGLTDASARGGSTPLSQEVLRNALLLDCNGARSWVDGLSLPPEEDADLDEDENDDDYTSEEGDDDDDDDGGAMEADEPEPPLSPTRGPLATTEIRERLVLLQSFWSVDGFWPVNGLLHVALPADEAPVSAARALEPAAHGPSGPVLSVVFGPPG
ncbi:unnamed protein product [Linum trigynum]|uniref:Uncharacterized protein n=1 Tax=Linum trigynum TaxID=586398 RepID=A0AAV2ETW2_9ROSI